MLMFVKNTIATTPHNIALKRRKSDEKEIPIITNSSLLKLFFRTLLLF